MRGRPERRRLPFLYLAPLLPSGKVSIFAVCHYGGAAWRLRARGPAAAATATATASAGPHSVRLYPRSIVLVYPWRSRKKTTEAPSTTHRGNKKKKKMWISDVPLCGGVRAGRRHECGGGIFPCPGIPEFRKYRGSRAGEQRPVATIRNFRR